MSKEFCHKAVTVINHKAQKQAFTTPSLSNLYGFWSELIACVALLGLQAKRSRPYERSFPKPKAKPKG